MLLLVFKVLMELTMLLGNLSFLIPFCSHKYLRVFPYFSWLVFIRCLKKYCKSFPSFKIQSGFFYCLWYHIYSFTYILCKFDCTTLMRFKILFGRFESLGVFMEFLFSLFWKEEASQQIIDYFYFIFSIL